MKIRWRNRLNTYDLFISRKSSLTNFDLSRLTEKYRRTELNFGISYASFSLITIVCIFTFGIFLLPHKFKLPFDFYIVGLPIAQILSINWIINYIFQLIAFLVNVIFYFGYFFFTMATMHQSCWILDAAAILAKKFDYSRNCSARRQSLTLPVKASLNELAQMTCHIAEHQVQASNLMRFNFLADLLLLMATFLAFIATLQSNYLESLHLLLFVFAFSSQFLQNCWMCSLIQTKLQNLSFELYSINWRRESTIRKDIHLMLLLTQNLKGFDGIIATVDLASFQKVRLASKIGWQLFSFLSSRFVCAVMFLWWPQ